MEAKINGGPAFAHIDVEIGPNETIIAESDAMSHMDVDVSMKPKLNGGFFSAIAKKFLGGESFFINEFTNKTNKTVHLSLVQSTPGEIKAMPLNGQTIFLQPGAYVASTPGLKLGVGWAGFVSGISREGFFRLKVSGKGTLFYGAYGALIEREMDGETIVDTSHLVAYAPSVKLKLQLAGGIFSSFFGGEGLVTRLEGRGKYVIQTRSISGLASWINPKVR
jgi:uncharacterized protein (TIGR00266 family)